MSQPSSPNSPEARADQRSPSTTTHTALDSAEVLRLIHEEADKEKGYLKFVQDQSEKDRAYFDGLFKKAVWFLSFLLAASGLAIVFFGIHTVSELREEMRATTQVELHKTQKELRDRIEAEFQTKSINDLVRQVAKERTERELSNLITQTVDEQVARGVKAEEPRIAKTVSDQTKQAVDRLFPVINANVAAEVDKVVTQEVNQRMAVFDQSLTSLGELADMGMRMRVGLRSGLEDLTTRARSAENVRERSRAEGLRTRIVADYDAHYGPVFQQEFNANPTVAALNITRRGLKDPSKPVPVLVDVIRSDKDLNDVAMAFIALRKATGQQFIMFDFAEVERWCKEKAPACD